MGRILGIDYGHVRMGLALTDPMQIIASAYKTLDVRSDEQTLKELKAIIEEEGVEKILLGIPMGLSGKKTQKTLEVEAFSEKLKTLGKEVVYWDESFSSVQAHQVIHKMGKKTGDNKKKIDMIAAAIVLQDYLKAQSF